MDFVCVRIWASGWRTWLSTPDLQFHLLRLVWDFSTAGRIVNSSSRTSPPHELTGSRVPVQVTWPDFAAAGRCAV